MLRAQCKNCKIHRYKDGLCFADVKKGRPVSTYTFCYAATPQESMNKKHIKEREEKNEKG